MSLHYITTLATILNIQPLVLDKLEEEMHSITGKRGVFEAIYAEQQEVIGRVLRQLGFKDSSVPLLDLRAALRDKILYQEQDFQKHLVSEQGKTEFDKAAHFAQRIAKVGKGFFLSEEFATEILRKSNPSNLLSYRGYATIDELLEKEDVLSAFSALRFVETNEWMHAMFDKLYSDLSPEAFSEQPIQIKVLGEEWHDIAEKFVQKKHHNVSHLKEFGVIFVNPIKEDIPGKLLRDFILLLHYFHEVEFYSKMFRFYSHDKEKYADRFKSLLRGDILDLQSVGSGEWLIVQRYLVKEDPNDPRLFLPRVNPESVHWTRGERDVIAAFKNLGTIDLELWDNCDWVAGIFKNEEGKDHVVSFDLADNAMTAVSFAEEKNEFFTYHQQEALWTKIFKEYAGGEAEMEQRIIESFEKGIVRFT
ncbi:MAG: hypothetical protein COU08_01485 [Candidatus Harrisonbacteria bacterium CG10_big_fil_rev_8_21_14_0_10_42_17]|uniref:Uncharacterized protein n=1 Tax=Candidatus Harrisonbacteria bacterium CG10_big_fil_rev_8_21_14_0_10_42_17 TaxID=1974584 RepID=A0A2M6WIM3_9BACT|nr:MAG: hypothetical protein COU08_01485 [Candidatus Harrisonbacteria bacterium CG10_big_fil_rev_8_21_14_0_10_42_17]